MKQLSELVDTRVVDTNGEAVGSVDELVLNCKTGKIDRVIVKTPDRTRFSLNWADLIIRGHQFIMKKDVPL
jgi:sporulation protein YlmC with PRC-barrel domain